MTEIATYFTNTVAVLVFSLLTLLLTLHVVWVLSKKCTGYTYVQAEEGVLSLGSLTPSFSLEYVL